MSTNNPKPDFKDDAFAASVYAKFNTKRAPKPAEDEDEDRDEDE